MGTTIDMAPIVIALGPGFEAGKDGHAVIETMRGHNLGRIIYVGKAVNLKNRVSQYFQAGHGHNLKTRVMVDQVFDFDTIIVRSEFEALVLECSLIKRHMPKYNILLKDDKGYPYLKINTKESLL